MKKHSTNYFNTFIEVAEDSKADCGIAPPSRRNKSIAERQYKLIANNPYKFTSDEILFRIFADRKNLKESELIPAMESFFARGQACLRTSPLAKKYGFGIHSNGDGKLALYPVESKDYQVFLDNPSIKKVKAMRTSKK